VDDGDSTNIIILGRGSGDGKSSCGKGLREPALKGNQTPEVSKQGKMKKKKKEVFADQKRLSRNGD